MTSNTLAGGRLPDLLGGFGIGFSGGSATFPLLESGPTKAFAVVPHLESYLRQGALPLSIGRPGSLYHQTQSTGFAYQPAAPELFHWSRGEFSYNPVAAIHKDGGAPVGDESVIAERSRPAQPGEIPVRDNRAVGKVQVFLGDTELPAQSILFAGVRPLSQPFEIDGLPLLNAGLNQLEIRIPDELPDGNHLVEVIVDGYRSPSRGFITVRRP